jgi:hypothetical protein
MNITAPIFNTQTLHGQIALLDIRVVVELSDGADKHIGAFVDHNRAVGKSKTEVQILFG